MRFKEINENLAQVAHYSNPIPVAVALVPHRGKLVAVRRAVEPRKAMLALPGGYINAGETFKVALSRELREETGIDVPDNEWEIFHVGDSLQSNRILLFGVCEPVDEIDFSFRSNETSEVTLIDPKTSLAFPLHEVARDKFFSLAR